MTNKYLVSVLLAVGLLGSAQADNTVIDSLRLSASSASTAPGISLPRDETKTSTLRSANVDENLKRTEQRLQVELSKTLAAIVDEALASN